MTIFRIFTSLLFLLLSFSVSAQKGPMKWGRVLKADLEMTEYNLEPDAEAVVLGEYATIDFSFDSDVVNYEFFFHKRIKILKESAVDRGNISIGYSGKGGFERIRGLKAQVIFPDGSREELGKKDFFEEKVTDNWRRKKFAFPNLKPGCVIEYKYKKISEGINTLEDWYFQEGIPVRFSQIQVDIPSVYQYVYLIESGSQKIEHTEDNNIQGGGGATSFKANRVTFKAENIPAMKEESYITTMRDYQASVRFQLKEILYSSGSSQKFLSTWKELAKELEENKSLGRNYLKSSTHSNVVNAAKSHIDKSASHLDKIKQAQKFITSQMKWDGSYGIWCKESLNKLFAKKIADGAEINLMLLAILRSQGLNAYPALTSTRDHGKTIHLYPIYEQFNHIMVYLEVDGKPIILDALDAFHPVGYPHSNSLNHFAWVLNKKDPKWIEVKTKNSTKSFLATFDLNVEGDLKGTINAGSNGYYAITEREEFHDSKYGDWKNVLEGTFPEVQIDSIEVINKEEIDKSLKVNIDCTIAKAAQVNGDFIYLNPVVSPAYGENRFKLEKRNYPVDQIHPWKENYILNLTIPEGYDLEELPEPVLLALPADGGRFSHQIKKIDDTHIQLVSKVTIKQTYFSPEEYLGLKKFIDLIIEKQEEQIVLKKKS